MEMVNEIKKLVDAKKEAFLHASDLIWEYAEIGFQEFQSAKALTSVLKAEGFSVEEGVAGIPTAFVASWGEGKPIIGLLGEFDALPALKHGAADPVEATETVSENGHGCGHNLLGAGALGAAIAVKDYMQAHGLKGTIRYYGCPGEEFGSGKMFMAVPDCLMTWMPPSPGTAVPTMPSQPIIHWPTSVPTSSSRGAPAMPLPRPIWDAVRWTPAS